MNRAVLGRRGGRRIALLVLAVAVTGATHSRMNTAARIELGERFVPRPDHARLSALGFDAVVSDYYWLQSLQVVGGEFGRTERHAPLIARLIELVTALDPWVGHPYRFAALWLTDSEESVRSANRLLERGIAYHPRDWRNYYHLGFNHFFYLEENRRAAEILEKAIGLEGAPRYLGPLVARLRVGRGGLETAAAFLAALARAADDEYARAEYLKALDEIETERAARYLDAARAVYWERRHRDIAAVEDLLAGPSPVLRALPKAHPHHPGFEWVLDPETGEIVSSYYGSRYQLHVHPLDAARRDRWQARRQAGSGT